MYMLHCARKHPHEGLIQKKQENAKWKFLFTNGIRGKFVVDSIPRAYCFIFLFQYSVRLPLRLCDCLHHSHCTFYDPWKFLYIHIFYPWCYQPSSSEPDLCSVIYFFICKVIEDHSLTYSTLDIA